MPYLLGADFHSFFLFLFCVNTVDWNMDFKEVFGLTFILKEISFIFFQNDVHDDFQSTVLAALACSLASIAPELQFYLACGICQVLRFFCRICKINQK